jgi:hypothetical protein
MFYDDDTIRTYDINHAPALLDGIHRVHSASPGVIVKTPQMSDYRCHNHNHNPLNRAHNHHVWLCILCLCYGGSTDWRTHTDRANDQMLNIKYMQLVTGVRRVSIFLFRCRISMSRCMNQLFVKLCPIRSQRYVIVLVVGKLRRKSGFRFALFGLHSST